MKRTYSKLLAVVLCLAMIVSTFAIAPMSASAAAENYTVEMDFNISNNAAGICFGATDSGNFYMWQINVEGGGLKLRPHRWVNNGGACLSEIDISGEGVTVTANNWYKVKYEISGTEVKTYIEGTLVNTYNAPDNIPLANLGFRQNGNEKCWYDNVTVTDASGTIFFEDFNNGNVFKFTGGELGGGGDLGLCQNDQGYELIWSVPEYFRETVETTYSGNGGLAFGFDSTVKAEGSGFVWVMNVHGDNFFLRGHGQNNGGWGWLPNPVELDGKLDKAAYKAQKYHHMKLEITPQGVRTFIDGTDVSYIPSPNSVFSGYTPLGLVGVRNHEHRGTYQNIKHYDLTSGTPVLVADYDFAGGVNIFNGGKVVLEDGIYSLLNTGADDYRYFYDATSTETIATYELIAALPEVIELADEADIAAARLSYNNLSTFHKSCLPNYAKLKDAEIALYILQNPGVTPAVVEVINKIDAIGYVTYKAAPAVAAARKAYDALSTEEQALVNNYAALQQAEIDLPIAQDAEGYAPTTNGTWSTTWTSNNFSWMKNPNPTELQGLKDAFLDEVMRRYYMDGFRITNNTAAIGVGDWQQGDWGFLDVLGGGDNVGKFINEHGPDKGVISTPFMGMAFSQIRHAADSNRYTNYIGSDFEMDGLRYVTLWTSYGSYDISAIDETDASQRAIWTWEEMFPGKIGGGDVTHNAFRYAYAKFNNDNKWDGDYVGVLRGEAAIVDDVIYQVADSAAGVKIVAGKNSVIDALADNLKTPLGAYVVPNMLADAVATLGEGNIAAGLQITGAPTDVADENAQQFENGLLEVDADGNIIGDFAPLPAEPEVPAELELSINISRAESPATSGETTKHDLVWSATLLVGGEAGQAAYDAFNAADAKIKEYGVYYGTSATVVGRWAELATTPSLDANLKKIEFDSGDDIDMYTTYSFRLRNCNKTATRAAMFYVIYTYEDGDEITGVSLIDEINPK